MFKKMNQDKVPKIFGIIMVVMALLVIASWVYHDRKNTVPATTQTVESANK